MTPREWQQTVQLVDALWPQVAMTDDVAREWFRHLEKFDVNVVREGLRTLAKDPKYLRYPGLGVVVAQCKAVTRRDTVSLPAHTGWSDRGGSGWQHYQRMRRKFLQANSEEG